MSILKDSNALKSKTKTLEDLIKSQKETEKAMLNVMEDLEETKKALSIARLRDEAMLSSIGEGLIAVDNARKIIMVNRAAENILGWKKTELIGRDVTLLPLEDEQGKPIPLSSRPTALALSKETVTSVTYYFVRKDKTKFPISIFATPIKLNGETIGLIEIFRDISREREIDRAKSEFVSLASHQLRTPLGLTKWHLEALQNEPYLKNAPKNIGDYLAEIYQNNERVLDLVRDLLSVSRIEQGRVKNIPREINPVREVTKIVNQMKLIANKKGISLNLSVEVKAEQPSSITIDALRFHEVIENLICNAIEYTIAPGTVDVVINKTGATLFISVKDTGIGISVADQKNIFTKFFRSTKAVEHNPEGTGLGLYVVKSYVEGWGGRVSVKSSEGNGSIFQISLPINYLSKEGDKP